MQPDSRDKAYLWDMLDAAQAVLEFVRDKTPKDYVENRMLRGAVERHIEIIGEAARRVSSERKHLLSMAARAVYCMGRMPMPQEGSFLGTAIPAVHGPGRDAHTIRESLRSSATLAM